MSQRAMACDFSVILNAGVSNRCMEDCSSVLDLIGKLEQQMSVYIQDSELSRLNRRAQEVPVQVEERLFGLLCQALTISESTGQAFDPTSGPLVALWRNCRQQDRIPTQDELDACLRHVGMTHVGLDKNAFTVQLDQQGVELNLGGIGKGYALDRSSEELARRGLDSWLLHGGQSSLLGRGRHHGQAGWPVGIGNPLFTGKRLGTILLVDQAMATSGSNIQYFRHQGQKYGHILDPRTGWPVDSMLSVTVLADTAAEADALSTAFYVMGVEKAKAYCDNRGIGAVLIPYPDSPRLEPVVVGIPPEHLFLDADHLA
jgi:thiamine biosynthesis lipoprotein